MATLNLGRIKPVFRGAYSGSTAYVVDDIVTHGNESFICIQAHGAGTQATSVTAYWTKLAAKGTDGTDVGTTITAQGDILYRDGSGLQKLAKPASTKVLQNTSGGVLSWITPSAGKTLQIARVDASGITSDSTTSNYSSGAYPDAGTAHCTIAFTPVSATSIIIVNAQAPAGCGGNGFAQMAIFSGSTCRAHGGHNSYSSDGGNACISASWVSGSTSAVSIQYRTVGSWGGDAHSLGRRRGTSSNDVTPRGGMVVQEIEV